MTDEDIQLLHKQGVVPQQGDKWGFQLFETHISWVFVGDSYTYKIKKPLSFSFLDFSSMEKRKYYCEREIELNNRQTKDIYLQVCPVYKLNNEVWIGHDEKEAPVIDHAVKMVSLSNNKRMDHMLKADKVTVQHIEAVAEQLASFHRKEQVIHKGNDAEEMRYKFSDIVNVKDYLAGQLGNEAGHIIDEAVTVSNNFLDRFGWLLRERDKDGYLRDCHGDLHSGNIFLYNKPVIFDCIEFNDDFRQIDVLDEIAFFCMDLEFTGREDFSQQFLRHYLTLNPSMNSSDEEKLFRYYKLHRANIKAKVAAIKAKQADREHDQRSRLYKAQGYLKLMKDYADKL